MAVNEMVNNNRAQPGFVTFPSSQVVTCMSNNEHQVDQVPTFTISECVEKIDFFHNNLFCSLKMSFFTKIDLFFTEFSFLNKMESF